MRVDRQMLRCPLFAGKKVGLYCIEWKAILFENDVRSERACAWPKKNRILHRETPSKRDEDKTFRGRHNPTHKYICADTGPSQSNPSCAILCKLCEKR